MRDFFHSVLADQITIDSPKMERAEGKHGIALRHDLLAGDLPPEFAACDIFYTELPWRYKFEVYEERGGIKEARSYDKFLERINEITMGISVPIVLIAGKQMLRSLRKGDMLYPIKLFSYSAFAIIYGKIINCTWLSDITILRSICNQFSCIGDFCCGYGRTGRYAVEQGKRYVLSDYNPKCIGFIHENL